MLEIANGSKYSGKFIVDRKEIDGELTFSGTDTNLLLHHPDFFRPDNITNQCVWGTLRNLTRVSLLHCLAPEISGSSWSKDLGSYESATIRPHFVLHGSRHLAPTDKIVKAINFVLKDAPVIFPDHSSFSTVLATPSQLRALIKEKLKITKLRSRIGKHPIVAYFSGQQSIFGAESVIGKISTYHKPSYDFGGPRGVSITNEIGTRIAFPKLVIFAEALDALICVLSFLEIIAGRRQEIARLGVELKDKKRPLSTLEVTWCNPPRRKRLEGRDPHPIDLPIDVSREPEAFASVLTNWLKRHENWKRARSRFLESFTEENMFDTDRLIGSANMFDLLPESAVPRSVALSKELREARDGSKRLFKALPESIERDSVLHALGRLGDATLKRKVRHRAGIVIEALGPDLPNLLEVLDLAVDARNHFVHGKPSKIDYVGNFFETVAFFSQALEFVFIVSDLLEAGWNIRTWRENGTTLSHPLASFLHGYPDYLDRLRQVLPHGHRLKIE